MSNVVKFAQNSNVRGPEATAAVVAFLRKQADEIESGESASVHKAVLVVYEDLGNQFRTLTAFCNITTLERVGLLSLALQDASEA